MTFAGLWPGRFTVCVTPIPIEPGDSAALRRLREKGDEHLPMTCAPVTITAEPTGQSAEVLVPDPTEE